MLQKIDMAMYQQMGFTKQQVKEAAQYAHVKKLDIFDALQLIQKRSSIDNSNHRPQTTMNLKQKNIVSSLLTPFKNINLNNYQILFSRKASRLSLVGKKFDLRQQTSPVGLLNVYNCCYLNSLLQCYFLSSDLIKYILQAEPISITQDLQQKMGKIKVKRIQNQFNLLYTLKDIFGRMCLTSKKYIDPTQVLKNLVDSVGQKIQFGEQKDLFETNIMIIERLNQCLLYTKKYFKLENQYKDQQQFEKQSDNSTHDESFTNKKYNHNLKNSQIKNLSPSKSLINKTKIREKDNLKRLFHGQKIQYTDPTGENEQVQQILSDFLGIIVNPAHQNLYKALYEQFHYDVEIQGKQKKYLKTKKHTYIRQAPQYMYFYINRTGYNAQQKHALKNQQKLSFDFIIYLDRFLQKYKQQTQQKLPLITSLEKNKNQLRKKLNNFQLFAKKLQQCRNLAQQTWKQKLPNQKQIQNQKVKIFQELKNIQTQLQKIQSRNEKYYLMYIFSHRGDAVSGHYWGYGKNGDKWYKFDINTKQMKEQQILLDLYKCGGTPYALVYVTQKQIPNFKYYYHTKFSQEVEELDLINMHSKAQFPIKQKYNTFLNPYVSYIPHNIKKVIISQNLQLHQQYNKRKNFEITIKTLKQYLTRYNYISSQYEQINKKSQNSFKILPCYDNFAIYLWSLNFVELAKYNIFAIAFKIAANNMTTKQLVQTNETLLHQIQKLFKKKVKQNKALRHFCVWYQPKQKQIYQKLHRNYLLQKQAFILVLRILKYIQEIETLRNQTKKISISQQIQTKINQILQRICVIKKVSLEAKNNSYIRSILNELVGVFMLKYVINKGQLKISQQEIKMLLNQKIFQQIKILDKQLHKRQTISSIVKGGFIMGSTQYYQSTKNRRLDGDEIWNIQDVGKGPNRVVLQKKFSAIMNYISAQVKIYKRLEKQGIFSILDPNTLQIKDYVQGLTQQVKQYQSLI